MDTAQFLQLFPSAAKSSFSADSLVDALNVIFTNLSNQTNRSAAFLAQTGYESQSFVKFVENLNYSADGLRITFPKEFPSEDIANSYARQPQLIANRVYANRLGNGDESSNDGWQYRGRGFIQCTGKANYADCGTFLSLDLINNPDLLLQLPHAANSAYWFWMTHKLNQYADNDDITTITKIINGGILGLDQRTKLYNAAKAVL